MLETPISCNSLDLSSRGAKRCHEPVRWGRYVNRAVAEAVEDKNHR